MREASSHKIQAKKPVNAFTVNHGVNPGWGVYEERPVIPDFGGVAEVSKLALMFTLWSRVEPYLYEELGIPPVSSAKEEKKNRAVLLESETYLAVLLCLLNNDHYSAGGMVDAMVGANASADQRGNARKRLLNRTLPIVGDHYGLLDYTERHMGNSMEYSICRSQRLVDFAERHLVPSINNLFDAPQAPAKQTTTKNRRVACAAKTKSTRNSSAKKVVKKVTKKAVAKAGEVQ